MTLNTPLPQVLAWPIGTIGFWHDEAALIVGERP